MSATATVAIVYIFVKSPGYFFAKWNYISGNYNMLPNTEITNILFYRVCNPETTTYWYLKYMG